MKRITSVIAFVLLAMAMFAPTAYAQDPAPALTTNEANCYRNLIETGDLFCLIRYELPTFVTATPPPGSAEAWCAQLVDQDGCTADPVEPTNETSLITDAAFVTLYQNCGVDCSAGTLENQVRVPRINHSIGGAYLSAGHAITWGDPTVNGCVESSAGLFSVQSQSCLPVIFNTAATDEASQRTQLGSDLVANLRSLESNRNRALNSYISSNNLITSAGRVLSIEAFTVVDQLVPARFQAASESSQDQAYATPTGSLALQDSLDTIAAGSDLEGAFGNLGTTVFGISGGAMATIVFLMLGIWFFAIINNITAQLALGAVGLVSVGMIGIYARAPTVSVAAVAAVAIGLVGAMFIVGKIRT